MKLKALLFSLLAACILNVSAQTGTSTAHLLAEEYSDLNLLDLMKINPALMKTKEGLAKIDREFFLKGAENSVHQPAAKLTAPAKRGQPAVDLYLYLPANSKGKALPVIYYMHGGGYLLGNARQYNDGLTALAEANQVAVVSVEYRLAPQAPFPADLDDAYHGLAYMLNNAGQFGIDPQKFILMGDSAGGGLAARLAIKVRDKGEFTPKGQVLIYPMLDYRTGTAQSLYDTRYLGEFVWTEEMNRLGWTALKGGQNIAEKEMPYYSAATLKDFKGLPPAYIVTGSLDLFAAENTDYANRLLQAGVPVDFQLISGVYHGFDGFNPASRQNQLHQKAMSEAIKAMFAK